MLPQLPLHPTAQQVQEPPPGPSRPPLYSPVKQSKRRGDPPSHSKPPPFGHPRPPLAQTPLPAASQGGEASPPVSGGTPGGDLPAGRGIGAPPSGSNKGVWRLLPRGEGQSRPCWGGPYTTRGRGEWGEGIARNTETPPALSAIPAFVCSGAAAPAPRTAPGALRRRGAALPAPGDSFTCNLYLGHPAQPKIRPAPRAPTSIFSPFSSREKASRSLRCSAASPSPPSRRWEGHHSPSPVFTAASVLQSAAPSWGRRRGRRAVGSGAGRVQAASPWN